MKYKMLLLVFFTTVTWHAQTVSQKLDAAVHKLLSNSVAQSASLSFYVADKNGKMIYEYQPNTGLSTASTQKIFTAAAALEELGPEYRYFTTLSYSGNLSNEVLKGNLYLFSTGDPTLGSWRYTGFKPEDFKKEIIASLKQKNIKEITGDLIIDDSYFDFQTVPGGWPWNDIGNYYGAGVWGVNWRENQFDVQLTRGEIKSINIPLPDVQWVNDVQVSGNYDQSLIFTAPHSLVAHINGKLPAKSITVSGATPNPPLSLGYEMKDWLQQAGISFSGTITSASEARSAGTSIPAGSRTEILKYYSPTLEKMVYWFMRKSINLYGETFVKTLAKEKKNEGSFSAGVDYLKKFWTNKGISSVMLNFADGSGLSPQNYVSAKAEVQALQWSQKQRWYPIFLESLPVQGNGMKMKSGTMKNTKSFAGYHTSKSGEQYTFAIIINNYQGSNSSDALYQILNNLK